MNFIWCINRRNSIQIGILFASIRFSVFHIHSENVSIKHFRIKYHFCGCFHCFYFLCVFLPSYYLPGWPNKQQVVELNGYVIIVVESRDNKIKLYGSPADKDNLEVADEILDVNERKLEDLPRAEVIRYIHEVSIIRIYRILIHFSQLNYHKSKVREKAFRASCHSQWFNSLSKNCHFSAFNHAS